MKYLLLSLLALFLAIAIGSFLLKDIGYVSGWSFETSLALFFIILLFTFIIIYIFTRSLIRTWQLPSKIKIWRENKRNSLSEKYITAGLVYMTEGMWEDAEKIFCKATSYSKSPYILYLFAARVAQEMNAFDRRNDYIKLAHNNDIDKSYAIGLTQAELQLKQGQTVQALATLNSLDDKFSKQFRVKQLLLETYSLLNDWRAIIELMEIIEKTNIYSSAEIKIRRTEAYIGLLKAAEDFNDEKELNKLWEHIPKAFKKHANLIETYVRKRLKYEDTSDCEPLLKDAIKRQWNQRLVYLYGNIIVKDIEKQLATAESWLNKFSNDSVLLLTLGKICIRNSLWTKAKEYLQKSIDIKESDDTYFQLADLFRHQGDYKQATIYYGKGISVKKKSKSADF